VSKGPERPSQHFSYLPLTWLNTTHHVDDSCAPAVVAGGDGVSWRVWRQGRDGRRPDCGNLNWLICQQADHSPLCRDPR
jgi:hypothetical protein